MYKIEMSSKFRRELKTMRIIKQTIIGVIIGATLAIVADSTYLMRSATFIHLMTRPAISEEQMGRLFLQDYGQLKIVVEYLADFEARDVMKIVKTNPLCTRLTTPPSIPQTNKPLPHHILLHHG